MRLHPAGVIMLAAFVGLGAPAFAPRALAQEEPPVFRLTLKDHRFDPARITVPANKRVVLVVKNADPTPAEFESSTLGVEKVISAGREAMVRIGPLKPGEYPFMDEFNQATARGVLIAAGE